MNKKTLVALQGSIAKWKGIVDGTIQDEGGYNCPLCQLFVYAEYIVQPCEGCPVYAETGEIACRGTPYIAYINARDELRPQSELDAIALEEVAFLESLLQEEVEE